jgi:CHASE2 domain-containing sensor protein
MVIVLGSLKIMNSFQDAFISYGRADSKQFAKKLNDCLVAQGLEIWFDFEDIPLGVDYQKQIDDGIDKAHNFLFVIAPHSINSPYCRLEIELALKRGKRIIPLLHVEQISRTTWQQRNPEGTDGEWQAYQEAGKHTSFTHMHPEISKINWVYFREGMDDFELGLQGLLEIFERQKAYVSRHTELLTQALFWERSQHQRQYLLMGEPRQQAEAWLKYRFQDQQPPCIPTDLHCEFICESLKNAQNLMTGVFLSHSEQDAVLREQIRLSLMREGLTVWINRVDIKTGETFQAAIDRGIEEANNFIYLISPDSLESPYCQAEITYALSLNKRIIPLLIEPVDQATIPPTIQALQFIDFTHLEQKSYQAGISDLLNVLQTEAVYYEQHKLLVAQSLKWQRQKYNPSILLRGHNLREAEAWFQVAQGHPQHPATPLQIQFIEESRKQPVDQNLNVFIVYNPSDRDFARKLNSNLQIQGMTTWFDQESIEVGMDLHSEMGQGIAKAENVLFIVSTQSIKDGELPQEIVLSQSLNKRIIPVVYQSFNAALPDSLSQIQWIDFKHGDFLTSFGQLIRTLASEPKHMQTHTRLLVKAREWEQADREDSFLLRGQDLAQSLTWLQTAETKDPPPSSLQRDYLQASQVLSHRKIKLRSVLLTSLATTIFVGAVRLFGLMQGLELYAYDHLLRLRTREPQDQRILIVTVDQTSGSLIRESLIAKRHQPSIGTIPDQILDEVLATLESHQPRLIGLDFYRDFPAETSVADRLAQTDHLIGLCKSAGFDLEGNPTPGVISAPEVPLGRVGFNDLIDDGKKFIRRHYLMKVVDQEFCPVDQSLSLVLARKYLESEGEEFIDPWQGAADYTLRFGPIEVPRLLGNGGGYSPLATALGGYQALINYRIHQGDGQHFAPSVSLAEVWQDQVPPELIRDRIVLIGYTDKTDRSADYWNTPYGAIPGVMVHGQMVSQLVSAVLDGRSLIWWWPLEYDLGWIWAWSLVGGLIAQRVMQPLRLLGANCGVLMVLSGSCYLILEIYSGWVPLIPAALGYLATSRGVAYLTYRVRHP